MKWGRGYEYTQDDMERRGEETARAKGRARNNNDKERKVRQEEVKQKQQHLEEKARVWKRETKDSVFKEKEN